MSPRAEVRLEEQWYPGTPATHVHISGNTPPQSEDLGVVSRGGTPGLLTRVSSDHWIAHLRRAVSTPACSSGGGPESPRVVFRWPRVARRRSSRPPSEGGDGSTIVVSPYYANSCGSDLESAPRAYTCDARAVRHVLRAPLRSYARVALDGPDQRD